MQKSVTSKVVKAALTTTKSTDIHKMNGVGSLVLAKRYISPLTISESFLSNDNCEDVNGCNLSLQQEKNHHE